MLGKKAHTGALDFYGAVTDTSVQRDSWIGDAGSTSGFVTWKILRIRIQTDFLSAEGHLE